MASQKMEGFWEHLEKLVGHVEVDSTVRNVIDTGIEESQKLDPEDKAEVMDAAVYLACDIVTVAKGGEEAKAPRKRKMAAEQYIKQKVKEGLPAIETLLQYHEEAEKEEEGKPSSPKGKGKTTEPRRGHHVINNDVKKIYRDIIKKFINDNKGIFFVGKTYQNLVDDRIINESDSLVDPLPPDIKRQIEGMTVHRPADEIHTDRNSTNFGVAKVALLCYVSLILYDIVMSLAQNNNAMPEDLAHQMPRVVRIIDHNICRATRAKPHGVYVDYQALAWWRNARGNMELFHNCDHLVRHMFEEIVHAFPSKLELWGRWVFDIHRQCQGILPQWHTIPP